MRRIVEGALIFFVIACQPAPRPLSQPRSTVSIEHNVPGYIPMPGFGGAPVREGWLTGADGVRLFYRLVGEGADTIVYVHGGPGTGLREGYDLEPLATMGHALLMYDQRGTGMSELVHDSAQLGVMNHVADLDAVLHHFALAHAKLLGLSWGAAIVAAYAAGHPDATDRIVFLSPISPTRAFITARFSHLDSLTGQSASGDALARRLAAAAPLADSLVARRCRDNRGSAPYRLGGPHAVKPRGDPCDYPIEVLRNRPVVARAGLASLGADYDLRPTLQQVRAPALVIEGALTNVPLDATREFARSLPNGRLVLIPEAGHQNWLDRPDVALPTIAAFMRSAQ